MRPAEHQHMPSVMRCSAQDSVSVLTAAPTSTNTNNTSAWGDGPDPLVIHLPGADGTAESSPSDPASGGLPNTPTVVSDSSSLAIRDPSAVQRRQSGELRFRPGSSGSRTLPSMLHRGSNALQSRAAAGAPAARTAEAGSLQPKVSNPFGFLPALQWGSSNINWGSPIGGTMYLNITPPADEGSTTKQQQQPELAKRTNMYWGSPIGGTLFINPSVDQPLGAPAAQLPTASAAAAADVASAAVAAAVASSSNSSSSTLPGVSKKGKSSRLPFLPPFQWGSPSSSVQWAAPLGGTLYINPQVPADWHEGSWGSGGSGFGSSSGGSSPGNGNGSAPGAGSGGSSSTGGSRGGSIGGVASKLPGGYVNARAAHASWGAVPPGVGLAKLGVGLMAAMAAAMLALYMKSTPSASNSSSTNGSTGTGTVQTRIASAAGAAGASASAVAAVEAGPAGVGFHQWMVQRLQSTLEGFQAEQAMLKTELAMLKSIPGANVTERKGVLGGLKRWLGDSTTTIGAATPGSGGTAVAPSGKGANVAEMSGSAAAAAALSGGVTGRIASLSPADVAARVAEIQEQLESIDVLRAALGVELSEQQQQLAKAQQEQQASQEQLGALTRR